MYIDAISVPFIVITSSVITGHFAGALPQWVTQQAESLGQV